LCSKVTKNLRPIDLGRAAGLSAQSVRKYEEWGFLPPTERSPTGYRRYGQRHLRALHAARAAIEGYGWPTARRIMQFVHRGEAAAVLATIDACHGDLNRRRGNVEETLGVLRAAATAEPRVPPTKNRPRWRTCLQVGEAAQQVGAPVSALRFWEAQGLLFPHRDESSRYRLYDAEQLRRLQVVVLLRDAGYAFDVIRAVLDEVGQGQPERAVAAAEEQLHALTAASQRCSAATAAVWGYMQAEGIVTDM